MATLKNQWAIYKAISPRIAFLIGRFISSLDYAIETSQRASLLWQSKSRRHRGDRYRVFLSYADRPFPFRKGW